MARSSGGVNTSTLRNLLGIDNWGDLCFCLVHALGSEEAREACLFLNFQWTNHIVKGLTLELRLLDDRNIIIMSSVLLPSPTQVKTAILF